MTHIRLATMEDSRAIAEIYNWYIDNTTITFEEQRVSSGDMAQRIAVTDKTRPWFVLVADEGDELPGQMDSTEDGGRLAILGYACAVRWKDRSAYRYARESSIYLQPALHGKGFGIALYQHLIDALRQTNVHTLIAGIALPNEASIALHEKLGYRKVGEFEEVGKKFDNYLNVGYWQLML